MSEAETGSAGRGEIWIEKYRPQTLSEVAGHENIVGRLESYIAQNDLPHLLFSGPAGVGKCVTGETPVVTNHGIERIESVVGDIDGFGMPEEDLEVLTFDEHGEFRYVAPSRVFGTLTDELVSIETRDGSSMDVTPEHKLLVADETGLNWTKASAVTPGDRVVRPLDVPLSADTESVDWVSEMDGERTFVHVTESFAEEHSIPVEQDYVGTKREVIRLLREGETVETIAERLDTPAKTVREYRRDVADIDFETTSTVCSLGYLHELDVSTDELREHVQSIQYVTRYNARSKRLTPPWTVTPELARFIGLAVSEAHIDSGRIKFYNTDDRLLDAFDAAAEEVFGLTPERGVQGGVPYRELQSRTLTHLLETCFAAFGDGIGSTLVHADEKSRAAFLRAVFDAEGHIAENGTLELTQKNEDRITLLSYLLAGVGVPSRRKTVKKRATNGSDEYRDYHTLFISSASALARFEQAVGFSIDRKAERLARVAVRRSNPNHDTMPVQAAVDSLCETLALSKDDLLTHTLNPETPGRERYIEDLNRVLDAATAKLEAAQMIRRQIDGLSSDITRIAGIPACWAGERATLEPIATRRAIAASTGVRTDRLLEYSDGRRTPEAGRAETILTGIGAFDEMPDIPALQMELRDAIETLGVTDNRVAAGTEFRGTDISTFLDNDDHDTASLTRFRTVADRIEEVAAEMLSMDVLESISALDRLATADCYFDEVTAVERHDEQRRVYDLTVPDTRNYVAGRVPTVMHNTTSSMAIAHEVYGDEWRENFLELNASDERGIDVVRDRIKNFARTSFGGYDYRIIFLDEADALCVPASTKVVAGYPSSSAVKRIDEVSSDGEPIPSVDFETNEIQSDTGRRLETGDADFYEVTLSDGRSFLASPRHPFFAVGDGQRLVETQLRDLTPGDEIADFKDDIGVTRCENCNEWTANTRFCSQTCKNRGHSRAMSDDGNPMSGAVAWNRGLTKADDERVAAQANNGEDNGNFGGEFHGVSIYEMDEGRKREWREQIRESRLGTTLSKEHRDAIARGVQRNRHGNDVEDEYESKSYRYFVPDEDEVPCEVCGEWYPTEGTDGIYVHHIDGDREHNAPENLLLVCPRCHNMECHDAESRFLEPGWEANSHRASPETDGGRHRVGTVSIESIEFDHHGPAYNITMEGTPNFMLANGVLTHNTSDAQSALRRTMEQFANNTRFILSCNYSSQIIDPIQSRCAVFRFGPLDDEAVAEYVRIIAQAEDINVTDEGVEALIYAADGDMRKAINGLQAAATTGETVDDEAVYGITSTARPEEIEAMVQKAITGDFTASRAKLDDLLTDAGLGGGDVIDQLHRSAWEFDLDDRATVQLLERVGETDYRITQGANERLQLEALLASLSLEAE